MYFTVPYALGIPLNAEQASIIALGLCSAGYVGEIIRGGINTLPSGQWLAAKAVGYSPCAILRYIILPQAIAHVIPALANECIQVVHATSVLSAIGTTELTKVASNIIAREMNPLIIYPLIAVLYLLITGAITLLLRRVEERRLYVNR
jgi:polar amino acid transport system permease protein